MKNFYASTIGEISVHPTDKMSFYIGEDDLMVKMYADLLCAHGPLNDVSIKVYDRPELDDLAYKICCMQYSAGEELPNRKNFMKARAERWRAYMNRVRSFCKMAETIEKSTERTVDLYRKGDGTLTLLVDTNYDGPYAPAETLFAIETVRKIVAKRKGFHTWKHHASVCCYVSDVQQEGGVSA